ncbi:MAG: hypothetical protein GYA41_06620 [Bacteroidales bacterium]|nr:hypothetical protein [Bacteroidales bacterium]
MRTKRFFITGLIILLAGYFNLVAQIIYKPPQKKLIFFGWHMPYIQQFIENIKMYETPPFDGISLRISKEAGGGNIFMVKNWKEVNDKAKEKELARAEAVKASEILTDNFIVLYGASQMDWFSDEDWKLAEGQILYNLKLARTAGCKGIVWDPEPYKPGKNPWRYNEQDKTSQYSFEQYYSQVRKRGAQFISVLQDEFPGIVIFSLRELSDWQNGSPFSTPLLPVMDREKTIDKMKNAWWGLHIAFYVGMIEAIKPGTLFIDGNEEAYYYTSPGEFYEVRNTLMIDAKALIPPELWEKHSCYNRIGHAIAAEYITGNWLGMSPFPYRLTGQGIMMSPEEKAQWLEHNTYYALKTADEYAWLYTEGMNWWTGEKVPEGFQEALLSAKIKVNSGHTLGYEIEQMIKNAQNKAAEFYKDKE